MWVGKNGKLTQRASTLENLEWNALESLINPIMQYNTTMFRNTVLKKA